MNRSNHPASCACRICTGGLRRIRRALVIHTYQPVERHTLRLPYVPLAVEIDAWERSRP